MSNSFRPHSPKQEQALRANKKFNIVGTGIQWGKTSVGAVWLKRHIHQFTDKNDAFIILAPTYKILQQSTLPAFLRVMDGVGRYLKSDSVFDVYGGGRVYIRSAQNPDSIVGITNVRAAWADEAGLLTLYASENLQARCAFKQAPMIITTSPYSLNWLYKDLIRPAKKGTRDDVCLIQAASWENPYFPREEYERRKKTMDPRRFRMIFDGDWERPEGLVYDCFDENLNMVDPFPLPSATEYYAGIDWGFRDPFVLIVRAFSPYGDVFDVSEFYKTGLTPSQIVEVCRQKQTVYGIKRFYCDPSRPDMIEELGRNGVTAVGADNDIRKGIDAFYELIKSRKYKIFRDSCRNLQDELDTYHYPEEADLKPDQDKPRDFELPVDQNNHCCDAGRYLSIMTKRSGIKLAPRVPDDAKKFDHPTDAFKEKIRKSVSYHD